MITRLRLLVAALAASAVATVARAEPTELRITRQPSVIYLAMVLMEEQKLVEKHAAEMGLPGLKASWVTFTSGGAATDALLSGNVDLVTSGVTNLVLLWARTRGQVKAVSAASGLPMLLVTRNPAVKTLRDFTDKDRIAVPTVKVSSQAILLQMALDQLYGDGGHTKLDPLMVQLGHPEAMLALLNPAHEVDSHFSAPPYQDEELKNPAIHTVLDSSDVVGGPVTNAVVFAHQKFHDANPKAVAAFVAALDEANQQIARDKRRAAEAYLAATREKYPVDEIVRILEAKNVVYSTRPDNTMKLAGFMAKIGLVKEAPQSWKDYFFREAHTLPGS
jgi:NitT/TauT family transport system substrate-binding protein